MSNFDDLIVYGRFNNIDLQSFTLDRIREGGNPTITTDGSPTIIAGSHFGTGALELTSNFMLGQSERVEWAGSNVVDTLLNEGCVEFSIKPSYAGSPSVDQYICSIGNDGNLQNAVKIYHDTSGNLNVDLYDASEVSTSLSTAFSPDGTSFYHVSASWDTSDFTLFVDGTVGFSWGAASGRTSSINLIRIGGSLTNPAATSYPLFVIDDLRIYDAHVRTGAFTPPTAELRLYDSNAINIEGRTMDTKMAYAVKVGTK